MLLAHIIATKTQNELVADDDMKIPSSGQKEDGVGHDEAGRTIAIHSLAVLPDYQKKGLGTILLKEYIQRMVEAETADSIAILTYDRLVPWYEKTFGFAQKGKSAAEFGGGNWTDMTLDFEEERIRKFAVDDDDDEEEDEYEEVEEIEHEVVESPVDLTNK